MAHTQSEDTVHHHFGEIKQQEGMSVSVFFCLRFRNTASERVKKKRKMGGGGGGGGGRRESKVAFFCCAVAALLLMETSTGLTSFPGAEGISSESKRGPSRAVGAWKVRDAGGAAAKATMRKSAAAGAVEGGGRNAMMTVGPGSYPPRCTEKCGRCRPCRAVHVAMPPGGTPVTAEYYPEAWRCKCGDRLYVP